ncbi:MAG: LysM peptidoglycan-binding domain-containing protein [Rhodospirillaceae bacterium]
MQIYLNNKIIGRAAVDANGGWRVKPDKPVAAGLYTLRADEVDNNGKVHNRVQMPFARAEPMDSLPPEPFVIVQPGNSLWRLARRAYGTGVHYTTIFAANKKQIQDPDMIFPGQVFAVPATN